MYVDDFNLDSEGDAESVGFMVAGATDTVVDHLEGILGVRVSATKSGVLASKPTIAENISRTSFTKKIATLRATKFFGAPAGGGRNEASAPWQAESPPSAKR